MDELAKLEDLSLVEEDDRWVLPLASRSIDQCCIDYAVTFRCSGAVEVRIEGDIDLQLPGEPERSLQLSNDAPDFSDALRFLRLSIVKGYALKTGDLWLTFDTGASLHVGGGMEFEPWEIAGPNGFRVVSVPGRELAIWRAR